ncbi:hybrid sensor histidine kinase/response regulator [Leptolyngbya ohadii]|uniref:hybrid sensor histidine kinase/response regulator n=1 Tax=Leptolyngbya ohadii TaxID=1962290 RepID=UPI000B5987B7|nr:ATP-binding protein [Leptolyngbya ohadii]
MVVPFVVQLVVAVSLTGWLSLQTGQRAVNQVATQLRNETSNRIRDRLDGYLQAPHRINQSHAEAIRLGHIDPNNIPRLEDQFWRAIQLYTTVSSIGFGSANGSYVASDRRGTLIRRGYKDGRFPETALRMYDADANGKPTRLGYTGRPSYDPRKRPWYQLGQSSPNGRWTDIFTYSAQPIYVISAVRAVSDPSGQFRGVLVTDLILSDISQFLQTLDIGQTGEAFIIERSGQLIADSSTNQPFRVQNGKAERLPATASSDPLIQNAAQFLNRQFSDLNGIQEVQQLDFSIHGERQFVQVLPYTDDRGLDWLIVVVIPEADFMQQIHDNVRTTVWLCLAALGTAIAIGLLTSRKLVRPIARLAAAATLAANGKWDRNLSLEREDELGVLADAFNRMAGQLRESLNALEEREAKLTEAQRVAHVGNWEYTPDTQMASWSEEMFRIYGLEPQPSPPPSNEWIHMVHPEDQSFVQQTVASSIENNEAFEIDFRIIQPDGTLRVVNTKGQPRQNEQGQVAQLFGTILDITERKHAETALRESEERARHLLQQEQLAREEAERVNRVKDEFLAILSHELRSPLNPILGWARLLQTRQFDAKKTSEALAIIERNAQLQTQLIDDLLDVARILRGKLSLKAAPVDLTVVIEAAIDTVNTAAAAKSIQIDSSLPPIGQVFGDATRLQQIVWNLLSNAIKFTPHGGQVKVELTRIEYSQEEWKSERLHEWLSNSPSSASDPPSFCAQVTVTDTGKGINPEFLPHIFESFRQEDASTTRHYGGLGLGLAIVRHLVEAHGGSIAAESPGEGLGATFIVKLPLLNVSPPPPSLPTLMDDTDLTGIRVLVVDDEKDARELLTVLLTQCGAEVFAVTSAAEVLTTLTTVQPDVLISDIGMPNVDGYALLQQVRSLPPESGGQIPAIALTAYAGEIDQQRALQVGFQQHITKPIHSNHLTQAIATLAHTSRIIPSSSGTGDLHLTR